jgi:hypothetical protein
MKLLDIKFILQRELQDSTIDDETVLIWCNNANSDFGVNLNIPESSSIYVSTTELSYDLPDDIKVINRLSLQSDMDHGVDKAFTGSYRIYNGKIIFPGYFTKDDTLNLDYYKQLTYFTDIQNAIDIDDRYGTIYIYYAKSMYYNERKAIVGSSMRDMRLAMMSAQSIMNMYSAVKKQIIQQYSFHNEPTTIQERW